MFTMEATVISQFAQIDKGDTITGGISKVFLKTVKVLVEDSEGTNRVLEVPVMTGNGIRGMLRREMLELILQTIVKKDLKCAKNALIDQNNFNLMNAGGGNDFQSQPYEILKRVKELNPLLSIFGTSLAVPGNLATPNALNYEFDENGNAYHLFYESENKTTGNKYVYSPLIATESFVKKDDILRGGENVKFLTEEQIKEWRESVNESQKVRSKERTKADKDTKKTKKISLQSLLEREYVIGGTTFYAYIEPLNEDLTNVEKGLLVLSLESFIAKKFGSNKARSYGEFSYDIKFDDESRLKTNVDKVTGKANDIYKDYSDDLKSCIEEANEWLENITCENVMITDVLK